MRRFIKQVAGNKPGKTYPEQSARQALRGMRRAQGGPGLTEGKDPQPRANATVWQ